jgi:uncharacterized protein (TIGR03085 family)
MPWVETERQALVETLRTTDPDAPTLCEGWDTRHLLAHLVQREHSLVNTLGDAVVRRSPGNEKFMGQMADRARSPQGYQALIARFLSGPPKWSPMSWAAENLNLVEYVIHHEDVRRGAGPVAPRALDQELSQAIWTKLAMPAKLAYLRSPVGVVLARPAGATQVAKKGPEGVVLTGEPVELALYVSGRRGAASVQVTGPPEAVTRFQSWVAKT